MEELFVFLALVAVSATITYYGGGTRAVVNPVFWVVQGIPIYLILVRTTIGGKLLDQYVMDASDAALCVGAILAGILLELLVELVADGIHALRLLKAQEAELPQDLRPPATDREILVTPVFYDFAGNEKQVLLRCERHGPTV